jgi:hypothetical protein
MLTQQAPDVDHGAVSALRQEVNDRLESRDLGVVCAAMCVDVWPVTGDWVAPKTVSEELVDAVRADAQHLLQYTDNEAMTADRVTLWLLAEAQVDQLVSSPPRCNTDTAARCLPLPIQSEGS